MNMKMVLTILTTLCYVSLNCDAVSKNQNRTFPEGFLFGSATAAYQIEGAWNENNKGENIWDHMTHKCPACIKDTSNGNIATDSFHNYGRDIEMMRELGLDAYRFSLSWSRILPSGFSNIVSEAGVSFYNNFINELLKYNIKPIVTLYHWDLPQKLQDLGGFASPMFQIWYEDYARVAFENFGDRVKIWITFNEPKEICHLGYGGAFKAPRVNSSGIGEYFCTRSLLLAHARAYHMYDSEFRKTQNGEVGITINVSWFEAQTDLEEDQQATERMQQGMWGLYAEPIFSQRGGFPKEIIELIANKSAEQGFRWSRLPQLDDKENDFIIGTADFFGVNHYTAYLVSATEGFEDFPVPSLNDDVNAGIIVPDEWPKSASSWLQMAPNSLFKTLTHLHKKYNAPIFYITENGWSTGQGLVDEGRITYYRAALDDVLDALTAGVDLKGYMAWTLMDNFEWMQGYTERFGLYEVDFEDPARPRKPRKSAFVYKQILKTRKIDHSYEPDTTHMQIYNFTKY